MRRRKEAVTKKVLTLAIPTVKLQDIEIEMERLTNGLSSTIARLLKMGLLERTKWAHYKTTEKGFEYIKTLEARRNR